MIGDAIFLILLWSVATFMVNRLYVIIRYREINVKGVVYSRGETPITYWVLMAFIAFASLLIGSMAVGMTLYYAGIIA